MPVNEILAEHYGIGGYDPAKPNGNVVERHVVTAETPSEQTIEVRDGAGVPQRTYQRLRNLTGENEQSLRQQATAALAGLRTIRDAPQVNVTSIAQAQTVCRQLQQALQTEAAVLIRLARLQLGALDDTT